jgi:hypothetical protein
MRTAVALAMKVSRTLPLGSNVVTLATGENDCPSCASSCVRLTFRVPRYAPVCGSKRKNTVVLAVLLYVRS